MFYLQANAAFIMAGVWSAFVFPLKSFVQANVAHVTVERLVTMDSVVKNQLFQQMRDLVHNERLVAKML